MTEQTNKNLVEVEIKPFRFNNKINPRVEKIYPPSKQILNQISQGKLMPKL